MRPVAENPYPIDAIEHSYWEEWNRAYFSQPVHAQLLDLEGQLPTSLMWLLNIADRIEAEPERRRMRTGLLQLEGIIELASEVAEHAFVDVVRPSLDTQR